MAVAPSCTADPRQCAGAPSISPAPDFTKPAMPSLATLPWGSAGLADMPSSLSTQRSMRGEVKPQGR